MSILGACWFAAVACADDEDRRNTSEDGGEGGDEGGGKGGTPSLGGSSTNAGKAGMSGGGKAGSSAAGEGGGSTAGDAGSGFGGDAGSGSGGDAGSGGSMGGAGGEPTSGGEGGLSSSGAGGEGGAPVAVAQSCVWGCEDDSDCARVDALAGDCNDVTKTCEDPSTQSCSSHEDCGGSTLFWSFGCTTTADCEFGYECVDYRGRVYCAIAADPDFGCDVYQTVTATLHEGGTDVEICVDPNARCAEGKCIANCEDVGCSPAEGDTCNPVTGRCECQNSTECGNGGVCADNLCTECGIDDDCISRGLDRCVAGKCGCADVGSCPAGDYPEATAACR